MGAVTADRPIRGDGVTDEADWVAWLRVLHPPALQVHDLLTAAQRLVVVSPHPDDEVLACGGLIAQHASRGGAMAVMAVTDGEASHRGDAAWPPAALAAARRRERRRGLDRLGASAAALTRVGLPDGAVHRHGPALDHALQSMLRSTDCVVGTWRLDGHPDHEAVGTATARACDRIGCRLIEAPVWMWHWSVPGDARVPWHRLHALPLSDEVRGRKAAALAEHATQLQPRRNAAPVLGPAIRARARRGAEYYFA